MGTKRISPEQRLANIEAYQDRYRALKRKEREEKELENIINKTMDKIRQEQGVEPEYSFVRNLVLFYKSEGII